MPPSGGVVCRVAWMSVCWFYVAAIGIILPVKLDWFSLLSIVYLAFGASVLLSSGSYRVIILCF